jgi:hypothetical protein
MDSLSRFFRKLGLVALLTTPAAIAMGPGCTQGKELCDLTCDCTKCSDRAFDECVISVNAGVDQADAYDCRTEYDDYFECQVSEFECDEDDNVIEHPDADDCEDEGEDYFKCLADATDLDAGSSGPGPTSGPTTSGGGATATSTTATGTGGSSGAVCDAAIQACIDCGNDPTACNDSLAGQTDAVCQAALDAFMMNCGM